MHDAVPIASGCELQFLTDLVRFVEKIVKQPQAGNAGKGHVATAQFGQTLSGVSEANADRTASCGEPGPSAGKGSGASKGAIANP